MKIKAALLTFEELVDMHEEWKRLAAKLSDCLAERYEKGTPVIVYRGGKEFRGTVVAGPNSWSDPSGLLIESHTGWRFRASFRDVEEQP